jgi:hypothetical protein
MYATGGSAGGCPWCDIENRSMKKADGGEIPWLERSKIGEDSIFAMLEPGEFIVRRNVAQKHLPQLHALNSGMDFGALRFSGGGATSAESPYTGDSGVLQVIYSDIDTGEKVGEAAGEYVGPGTAQPGYYGGDWAGHTGHVHTSFATSPSGAFYGLPKGTDIRQGAAGFPDWVYELGAEYGVDASTYAGHQESSGFNRGIDWWPHGKADMSGQSYSHEDRITLTTFAEAMAGAGAGGGGGTGAPAAWGDMLGGGGGYDGDDEDDYDDYWGDDSDQGDYGFRRGGMAGRFGGGGTTYGYSIGHGGDGPSGPGPPSPPGTRTADKPSKSDPLPVQVVDWPEPPGGGGTRDQPGFVPAQPDPRLGPGPHAGGPGEPRYSPYGPLPPQSSMSQDQYDKWRKDWDERILKDSEQGDTASDLQDKINQQLKKIEQDKAKAAQLDKVRDDNLRAGGVQDDKQDAENKAADAADREVQNDIRELNRLKKQQIKGDLDARDKTGYPEAPGMKGKKGEGLRPDAEAEKLGKGFVQGIFQELGFTEDVFGKPFTEWGIWKMAMTGLGFGAHLLKDMSPQAPAFTGNMGAGPFGGGKGFLDTALGLGQGASNALGGPNIASLLPKGPTGSQTDPLHVTAPPGRPTHNIMDQAVPRDEGGWLHPGQAGINLTGKPELVLTPAQSSHLVSGGGSVQAARYGSLAGPGPGGAPPPPAVTAGQQGAASAAEGLLSGLLPRARDYLPTTINHFDNRGNISTESERAVTKIAAPQPRAGTFASGSIATMRA